MSNFLTPAPGFATAAKVLAGQACKGVKDNIHLYTGSGKPQPITGGEMSLSDLGGYA